MIIEALDKIIDNLPDSDIEMLPKEILLLKRECEESEKISREVVWFLGNVRAKSGAMARYRGVDLHKSPNTTLRLTSE